ncbi:calcium/proton exchanger [Desarmillaria tabescens]|uniref:Vacuolar calcium ion transporter n=1 Tax=Armillaria tabescens TaxID=1929756 RepID=A0AA39TTN8_ARMTA|nr:calcium/proton exchanger [Desarmillaria tabescens]KAK0469857.1 calcium/proton exchanger [Desarmillaria tabescens]
MSTLEKVIGPLSGVWKSIRSILLALFTRLILLASWLNLLLPFIPVSWALHFTFAGDWEKDTVIFVCSFLAIIPLAKLLDFVTDELSLRVGQTLAGLLNVTFGNAVELIFSIISLLSCELQIVQSSLVSIILINLLLILGMCFFVGGIKFQKQGFGQMATQLNSSLLAISVIAVLSPAAFHFSVVGDTEADEASDILNVSHGTSIILLFIYISYLVFQLFSHASLYADEGEDSVKYTPYGRSVVGEDSDLESGSAHSGEEVEQPQLGLWVTVGLLVIVTLVAFTTQWLVDSINGITKNDNINNQFVGVILLPIICRTPDGVTIVTTSVKDKLNISLGLTQIALFMIPFIVTLAWILDKPLTLLFDPYESIVLFFTAIVLTVNYVVQSGKSNWLQGMILMCLYVILAVTFWSYPGIDPSGGLLMQCTT